MRSLRSAMSRRIALGAGPRRQLHELEAELQALEQEVGGDEQRRLELHPKTPKPQFYEIFNHAHIFPQLIFKYPLCFV